MLVGSCYGGYTGTNKNLHENVIKICNYNTVRGRKIILRDLRPKSLFFILSKPKNVGIHLQKKLRIGFFNVITVYLGDITELSGFHSVIDSNLSWSAFHFEVFHGLDV